jgi:tRNA(fMet)-specific endonuclease VapC
MAGLRYLLDTNVLSDLVRNPQGVVTRQITRLGQDTVCTSIIVACELRFGAAKKDAVRLTQQLELILDALPILPLEAGADSIYGEVRAALEKAGQPIGPNDLLIASQALALGLTLVTDNIREFERVPGLKLENWLGLAAG